MSWSQIVQQAQGYGVTSTSGGVTDPSTPMGAMPGYVVSPLGLTPPDFSIWSMPPQEVPPPPRATCIPIISASRGEGHLAEGRYRQAGSGDEGYGITGPNTVGSKITSPTAAGSSDGTNPHTSRQCSHQSSLRGEESPSTPLPIKLWP